MKNFSFPNLLLFLLAIFSFSSTFLYSQEVNDGDSASLGNGTIKSWIKTDASNNPQSIGLTLTEGVLTNLPAVQTSIHLNLPKTADDTLFNHLYFGWNPAGHPPAGIYNLPHFDLHFYIISKEERLAIPGGPDTTKVEQRFVPPDYVSDPAGVPQMGTHWTDTTSPEFHGQVFDETFIYGYANGKFCFLEPMFTKAFLESHPHFTGIIKQPAESQKAGYYPTTYKIVYDSVNHVYNFEITDMVWHDAATPTAINDPAYSSIPERFELNQNYPNPFNPSTIINYQIPEEGFVTLKVYDILGKEVKTLLNENKPAGSYNISFDASSLVSGVYIYQIRVRNSISGKGFTATKKLMLIK